MILVPMLWEETLHFRVFAPMVTAGVLAAFVITAATFWGGSRESSPVLWIAYGAVAAAAIALSVATHAMLPFVLVLLLVVLLCEGARTLGRVRPMWPLVALAADAAVSAMIFVYSGPQNARAEYPELSLARFIASGFAAVCDQRYSVAVRIILQGCRISAFEIVQVTIAFGLAVSSVLLFCAGAAMVLGLVCRCCLRHPMGRVSGLCANCRAAQFPRVQHVECGTADCGSVMDATAFRSRHGARGRRNGRLYGRGAQELPISLNSRESSFSCAAALVSDVASIFSALLRAHSQTVALACGSLGGTACGGIFDGQG